MTVQFQCVKIPLITSLNLEFALRAMMHKEANCVLTVRRVFLCVQQCNMPHLINHARRRNACRQLVGRFTLEREESVDEFIHQ